MHLSPATPRVTWPTTVSSSPTPVSDNCVLPALEHSLSVGCAAVLETGSLPPQDHKSGTVCHSISDYVGCHTASSGGHWRYFIRTVTPRHSVNCFLTVPNILTYLLTSQSLAGSVSFNYKPVNRSAIADGFSSIETRWSNWQRTPCHSHHPSHNSLASDSRCSQVQNTTSETHQAGATDKYYCFSQFSNTSAKKFQLVFKALPALQRKLSRKYLQIPNSESLPLDPPLEKQTFKSSSHLQLKLKIYTPCPDKKGATDFFCCKNIDGFSYFLCTTSQENAKVIGMKISCHTFVMLLPYRMKISDTKITHFTPILSLCTCLYRSHLQKPVSMKQTKHSRKSEAQNLCSKCPPFTRTHAFKRLRHCAIAAAMTVWSSSLHSLSRRFFQLFNIMDPRAVDPLLKHTSDDVVHRIQI